MRLPAAFCASSGRTAGESFTWRQCQPLAPAGSGRLRPPCWAGGVALP